MLQPRGRNITAGQEETVSVLGELVRQPSGSRFRTALLEFLAA
jgi:hypothetical protein